MSFVFTFTLRTAEASDGAQQRGDGIAEGDGPKGCPRQRAQRPPYLVSNSYSLNETVLAPVPNNYWEVLKIEKLHRGHRENTEMWEDKTTPHLFPLTKIFHLK